MKEISENYISSKKEETDPLLLVQTPFLVLNVSVCSTANHSSPDSYNITVDARSLLDAVT
jgi:hypothetical protein